MVLLIGGWKCAKAGQRFSGSETKGGVQIPLSSASRRARRPLPNSLPLSVVSPTMRRVFAQNPGTLES